MQRRRDLLLGLGFAPLVLPAQRCIVVRWNGGASHLDTFDMKPDAASTVRGPFRPLGDTGVSELFPRLAARSSQFTIVRGLHHNEPSTHEAGVALLDRLLPAGVETIETTGWDCHGMEPYTTLDDYRVTGDHFDRLFSRLVDELDGSTVLVAIGEFGRSPKINLAGGRDHWRACQAALIAGGPIRGGQIIGGSDATGAEPVDGFHVAEFAASVHHALGSVVPVGARPIARLFS